MQHDGFLVSLSDHGRKILDLVKKEPRQASELMASLSREERISLVSHQSTKDPKTAQELLFLLDDNESKDVVQGLNDRTVFRIMKAQTSTHIGVLSLLDPTRIQSVLDLDQELFSTKGTTDPATAYHWMISFLEEDEAKFAGLLQSLDLKVVASAFQDKIVKPTVDQSKSPEEEDETVFPADFMVKLDRGELKPDDLEVTDEETLDILTKIYLTNEDYFNELISLMIRDEDLKARSAEDAFARIHEQVGDMSRLTEDADDMFVPLDE
jgi:hypothetical protein